MTTGVLPDEIVRHQVTAEAGRWAGAFVLVLLLHAAAMVLLLSWKEPVELTAPPPAAVMIDLAPLPAAPTAEDLLSDLPLPDPAPVDLPEPIEDLAIDLAEPVPVDLPEPIEELPIDLAEPAPVDLPEEVSELALELPTPVEIELPRPAERSVPPPPRSKPKPRNPVEQAVKPSETPPGTPPPQPTQATTAAAPPAPTNDASISRLPADIVASWQASVSARVKAALDYPRSAQRRRKEGVALVRIQIDRAGQVLLVQLARGTGSDALDEEAVAAVRQASPLPPPPPGMMQSDRLSMTLPVGFKL